MIERLKKNQNIDKLVLLAIFAISLIPAYFIVLKKSSISISSPIELPYSGLSVALPESEDWKSAKKWSLGLNTFVLNSVFTNSKGQTILEAKWQYQLEDLKIAPEDLIIQESKIPGVQISKKGQLIIDNIPVVWASLKQQRSMSDTFLAIAKLPNDRYLSLALKYPLNEKPFAQKLFFKLLDSINYESNIIASNGDQFIKDVKTRGLESFINPENKRAYYTVQNEEGDIIGFSKTAWQVPESSSINAINILHLANDLNLNKTCNFKGDQTLGSFSCQTKLTDLKSDATDSSIISYENAEISASSLNKAGTLSYTPPENSYLDILTEPLAIAFLQTTYDNILIYLIADNGQIIPTIFSKLEGETPDVSIIEIQLSTGSKTYKKIHVNSNGKVLRKELFLNTELILERTGEDQIIELFPEWQDYILQLR